MEETNIFKLGTLAHFSMVLIYLIKSLNIKNIYTFIYLFGHLFITIAMLIRIVPEQRAEKHTAILGSTGHTFLLIYFIYSIYQMSNPYKFILNNPLFLNIFGLIGQIGMISIYWDEYNYYNKRKPKNIMLKNMTIFAVLCFFLSSNSI